MMNTTTNTDIQAYTGGYDNNFKFDTQKFQCPVCLLVIRVAMQTSCGHRFCESCVKRIMGKSTMLKCPIDKMFSKRNEIFPDIAFQREIMSLHTRCSHELCPWDGELRYYERHTKTCSMEEVPCPLGCDQKIPRGEASTHHEICPKRETSCEFCDKKVQHQNLEVHRSECPKYPLICLHCQREGILREDMERHIDALVGTCPDAVVPCPYVEIGCTFVCRREEMKNHMLDNDSIATHLRTISTNIGAMQSLLKETRESVQKLTERTDTVENSCQGWDRQISSFKKDLEQRNVTGQLHWKLDVRGTSRVDWLYKSDSFYTGCPGYLVHIDMANNSRDGNIRFGLTLLLGAYDVKVMWPFNALCYVTILDQKPGNKPQNLSCSMEIREMPRNRNGSRTDRLYKRTMAKTLKKDEIMGHGSRFIKNGFMHMEISVVHCVYPLPETAPLASMSPLALHAVNGNGNMTSAPVLRLSTFLVQ